MNGAVRNPPSNAFVAPGSRAAIGKADGNSTGVKRPYIYNVSSTSSNNSGGSGDTFARAVPGSGTFDRYVSRALSTMSKTLVPTSAFDRHQTYIQNYMANYGKPYIRAFSLKMMVFLKNEKRQIVGSRHDERQDRRRCAA